MSARGAVCGFTMVTRCLRVRPVACLSRINASSVIPRAHYTPCSVGWRSTQRRTLSFSSRKLQPVPESLEAAVQRGTSGGSGSNGSGSSAGGFWRVLLGTVAGTAVIGVVAHNWPSGTPFMPAAAYLAGATTLYLCAGRVFRLSVIAGMVVLAPLGAAAAVTSALVKVTREVQLKREDREELQRLLGEYMEVARQRACEGGALTIGRRKVELDGKGGDCDPREIVNVFVPVLKVAFYSLCDVEDKDPITGELVLTRERIDKLSIEASIRCNNEKCDGEDGNTSMPNDVAAELFLLRFMSVADKNGDDYITFAEFASTVLCLLVADLEDPQTRNDSWFQALDLNNDGVISREELVTWTRAMVRAGALKPHDAVRSITGVDGEGLRPATAEEVADEWLHRFGGDGDDDEVGISREQFDDMAAEVDFEPILPSRDWMAVFGWQSPA